MPTSSRRGLCTHLREHGRPRRAAVGPALLSLVALLVLPALAPAGYAPARLPADLDVVLRSDASFVSFRIAELASGELARKMPLKVRAALLGELAEKIRRLGVKPEQAERLTLLSLPGHPEPVALVRTTTRHSLDQLRQAVLGDFEHLQVRHRGRTIYHVNRRTALCVLDDQVYLVGGLASVVAVLDAVAGQKEELLAEAVDLAAAGHHVVVGVRPEVLLYAFMPARWESDVPGEEVPVPPIPQQGQALPPPPPPPPGAARPGFHSVAYYPPDGEQGQRAPSLEDMLRELPPAALPYKPLFLARTWVAAVDLGEETKVQWRLSYTSAALARDGEAAARTALYVLRELVPQWGYQALGRSPKEAPQLFAFLTHLRDALRAAPVEQRDRVVSGTARVRLQPAVLTAAFAEMEREALRVQSAGKFKQMALAMHNYLDVHGRFPAAALSDRNGKPLLSWRVAILPYIEEEALYKQFKLDEPWDSPHNRKLLEKMPRIYRSAGAGKESHTTSYRVFSGPGTVFDPRVAGRGLPSLGTRIFDITDGTSNTVMIVEAGEAVPWTKPEPLPFDPQKPLPRLGGAFPGGFHAAFADGAVHFLRQDAPADLLRLLITASDGQPIDLDRALYRRGERSERRPPPGADVPRAVPPGRPGVDAPGPPDRP